MKKLDEAWKPQAPPGDFSSRVLEQWKSENATRARDLAPRRSRARDVVLFSLGASLSACAALTLWFSLRRAPHDEPIRPDDRRATVTASSSSQTPIPTAAAGSAARPAQSAGVMTIASIERGRQPACKAKPVPDCKCQPSDPLCDCTPPNCPDLRIGDPPRKQLRADEVEAIVAMHKEDLDNQCLRVAGKQWGPTVIELGITKRGSVNRITVSGTEEDPAFTTCVVSQVSLWTFPEALQPSSVSVPLVFKQGPQIEVPKPDGSQ